MSRTRNVLFIIIYYLSFTRTRNNFGNMIPGTPARKEQRRYGGERTVGALWSLQHIPLYTLMVWNAVRNFGDIFAGGTMLCENIIKYERTVYGSPMGNTTQVYCNRVIHNIYIYNYYSDFDISHKVHYIRVRRTRIYYTRFPLFWVWITVLLFAN
jgi:hypothetical protein